ncbi:STAS domain-containing protein [Jatrophihabitans endophyticus]|uniref:STAS domain-containing protein n=1 Tax=Jatrophihabitans endophyticus TaxID=1206085 RepID=UPI0019F79A70|nr:STAS domain-containing protein [Jatrophihabitans endophyticus]MBE7189896.1 STAS domain-containing protein [Jatrophihabitans endophyticus]
MTTTDSPLDPAPRSDWRAHRARAAQMTVETVRADSTGALVRVEGELDMATAAPLWAVLQGHLAVGRRFLRLDVRGLRFLDATALTGITAVHRDALSARGTLILTGVQSVVGRVLSLTGLDDVLFIGGPRADDDIPLVDDLVAAGV